MIILDLFVPDAVVDMNGGKDNNIELMNLSLDSNFAKINANSPNWMFKDKGGFCFKVVPWWVKNDHIY